MQHRAYKYRIYPTQEQRQQLQKVFGCCRFVYNQLLTESIKEYETYKQLKASGHLLLKKPDVSGFYFMTENLSLDYGIAYQRGTKDGDFADKDLAEIPPLKGNLALNYEMDK